LIDSLLQLVPGCLIELVGRIQVMRQPESGDRLARVVAVLAIDLSRRNGGAIQQDLCPKDSRNDK